MDIPRLITGVEGSKSQVPLTKTFSHLLSPDILADDGPQELIFQNIELEPETRILAINRDKGHDIALYTCHEPSNPKEAILSLCILHIKGAGDMAGGQVVVEFHKSKCLDEHRIGDPIKSLKLSLVKSGSEILGCLTTASGYWTFI